MEDTTKINYSRDGDRVCIYDPVSHSQITAIIDREFPDVADENIIYKANSSGKIEITLRNLAP